MTVNKVFYEKNKYLLESEANKTFDEIVRMDDPAFLQWVMDMRDAVLYAWDVLGIPPRVGYDEAEIIDQFNNMTNYDISDFEQIDELTGKPDCIRNTLVLGNVANQFFPTMMKTKINYTKDLDAGLSIYDHFKDDKLLKKVETYSKRHFRRDSFYHYSNPVQANNKEYLFAVGTAREWLEKFNASEFKNDYDFWIQEKENDAKYTGYAGDKITDEYTTLEGEVVQEVKEGLAKAKFLTLTAKDLAKAISDGLISVPDACMNVDTDKILAGTIVDDPNIVYHIRLYKKGQKVFPLGLKAFRVSWCQYAVNFPPMTAKFLYEKFTEHCKDQERVIVYDPSSGWGGRILGAMAVREDRHIHYVGTDPNTDHWVPELNKTKYELLADMFNEKTYRGNPFFGKTNTYEIFQHGSEEIHKDPEFQKYKGQLDMVFTSPPYFGKEGYSQDETQSFKKFPQFDNWVNGFLKQTLTTAVEYLKEDRYLLWNIADAKFGNDMLPLEQASNDILKSLGMEYKGTLKMVLAQMPGGNRLDENGKPRAKNFCKVKGINFKYEPIFVWYKPKKESV